jgi:hypothetical protein
MHPNPASRPYFPPPIFPPLFASSSEPILVFGGGLNRTPSTLPSPPLAFGCHMSSYPLSDMINTFLGIVSQTSIFDRRFRSFTDSNYASHLLPTFLSD